MAQVAQTVLQAVGGTIKSFAQIQGGELSYKIARMRASAASFEGQMQNLSMQQEAYRWMRQGYQVRSQQHVAAAGAGVALDSKTFQNIAAETMAGFQEDVRSMLKQGEIYKLFGDANATMLKGQGRVARAMGYMDALSTQIQTASNIMSIWGGGGMGGGGGGAGGMAHNIHNYSGAGNDWFTDT